MAAVNARPVGRRSHSVQFQVPRSQPPLPLDNALAELAQDMRAHGHKEHTSNG